MGIDELPLRMGNKFGGRMMPGSNFFFIPDDEYLKNSQVPVEERAAEMGHGEKKK